MINKIVVTNPKGEALELELFNPEKSGFTVAKVEGLGPPKANINGQEMATSDGMFYTSAKAEPRQIIFTLEFRSRTADSVYGELTIEQCRRLCYRYFPLKKQITITIYTDEQILYTIGYVESNEPEIFSSQEYAIISVLCPDPWMYSISNINVSFAKAKPMFEFPFSNESLTNPMLEFGQLWQDSVATLEYNGTVDTGFVLTIHLFSSVNNDITIYNLTTGETMTLNNSMIVKIVGSMLTNNDEIILSTVRGNRYCKVIRNGVTEYNVIGCLDKNTDWFQLSNGENDFGFSSIYDPSIMSIMFTYQNAYMGV